MSSKSQKKSKSKKNEQQRYQPIDSIDEQDEVYHEGDEDYVTKKYVYDMMKVQEPMFHNLFESMLTSTNKTIDGVIKDLAELRSSLQFTQKDVADLKPFMKKMLKIEKELRELQGQVDYHSDKMESLENQKHRNNIRINGIPEEPNETWDDIERKAKIALERQLNLPFQVEIKHAHHTGKGNRRSSDDNASATDPRTIIFRLVSCKQKDPILKAARIEKPEGMFVNEDLAAETLQRRKDQLPKLKQAKQARKIAYFVLDKLIIKDRPLA